MARGTVIGGKKELTSKTAKRKRGGIRAPRGRSFPHGGRSILPVTYFKNFGRVESGEDGQRRGRAAWDNPIIVKA